MAAELSGRLAWHNAECVTDTGQFWSETVCPSPSGQRPKLSKRCSLFLTCDTTEFARDRPQTLHNRQDGTNGSNGKTYQLNEGSEVCLLLKALQAHSMTLRQQELAVREPCSKAWIQRCLRTACRHGSTIHTLPEIPSHCALPSPQPNSSDHVRLTRAQRPRQGHEDIATTGRLQLFNGACHLLNLLGVASAVMAK